MGWDDIADDFKSGLNSARQAGSGGGGACPTCGGSGIMQQAKGAASPSKGLQAIKGTQQQSGSGKLAKFFDDL